MARKPSPQPILWSPRSEQDLLDIWHFYAHAGSPELADRLVEEISFAVARLETYDLLGRRRPELGDKIRALIVSPYTVFYRIEHRSNPNSEVTGVSVVRVLHERRDLDATLLDNER